MNRRDIMKLFGLGGAAAALPTVAIAAAPVAPTPKSIEHPLHRHFLEPLDANIHMKGGKVYTYRAHRHPDVQSVRVSLMAWASGIIEKVTISRHGVELISIPQSSMDTPFCTQGARIDINITGRLA